MEKPKTFWYAESKDSHTNAVIAEALEGLHSTEKFTVRLCSDGKKRNLIEVPDHAFIERLQGSKSDLNINFRSFRAQGNSLPGPWIFQTKKKQTIEGLKKKGIVRSAAK